MLTTVLLDIDNTLLDFHAGAEQCIREGFAAWGLPYTDQTFGIFTPINNRLWREIELGTRTREQLYQERWRIIFAALGIDADGPAFEVEFRQRLTKSAVPVEGAMEILPYLADKYTLCAASNGPYQQQIDRLQRAGMFDYFTHLFISEEMGHQKPTRRYFELCMERLGQPDKDGVMIIGDSLTADVGGGRDFGIKTGWYNHDKQEHPANLSADVTVEHLLDLKKWI